VGAWKGVASLAIVVAGALGVFALNTFGRDDGDERAPSTRAPHVYTLRDGDVALRPEAGARCEASGEGGRPDLFCTRIGGGRHQVIFYDDAVVVWPLDCPGCGPDGPAYSYVWTPYVLKAGRQSEAIGGLQLLPRRRSVTYADAIAVFGEATRCKLLFGSSSDAEASWSSLGLRVRLATLGGLHAGKNGCTAPRSIYIDSVYVTGTRWQTTHGLRVGAPVDAITAGYPHALRRRGDYRGWRGPAYWLVHVRARCSVGVCGAKYHEVPRLIARVRAGRIAAFVFPVGAQGE
jgi:hypothetical protein